MSSTRYARTDADPGDSPERHLSAEILKGINVGMQIISRVARVLPQSEREAMLWLSNFARLRDFNTDALSIELGMCKKSVREALTNAECDRSEFVTAVGRMRAKFEGELDRLRPPFEKCPYEIPPAFQDALCQIADTAVARKIQNAVAMCDQRPQIIECIGHTRLGKSIAARRIFLRNLHRAAWVTCPKGGAERDWLLALAGSLGVSLGNNCKNTQIVPKIMACLGGKRISFLFVDEGYRLWPVGEKCEPTRIEFLRDIWEQLGVSVLILATPQYSAALADAMRDNPRWAPGQWLGRVQSFDLPQTLTHEDFAAVARHYAPEAAAEVITQLAHDAAASEGRCGTIARVVERARFRLAGGALTLQAISEAHRLIDREGEMHRLRKIVPIRRTRLVTRSNELPAQGAG